MVLILNKNATKKQIAAIEKKLQLNSKKTGFDAKKYSGAIPFKGDGLEIQMKLRDEWERDFN